MDLNVNVAMVSSVERGREERVKEKRGSPASEHDNAAETTVVDEATHAVEIVAAYGVHRLTPYHAYVVCSQRADMSSR